MQAPKVPLLHHSAAGCVVVHKPPGVPFHAAPGQQGLLEVIRSQQGSEHLPYTGPLYPVHRLDSITSGALVLATSQEAAGELVAQFRSRQVSKYYVSLSDRRPAKKMGSVVGDMRKSRRGSWVLERRTQHAAITRFITCSCEGVVDEGTDEETEEQLAGTELEEGTEEEQEQEQGSEEEQEQEEQAAAAASPEGAQRQQEQRVEREQQRGPLALRAFLLKPETGKTHQLRVAMKSLGSPVLGDERYALKTAAARQDRGYLHCAALRFELRGRPVQVVCPPAHGRHFTSPAFQSVFGGWFPEGLAADHGMWFPDSKLLRSQLTAEPGLEEAAVDLQW